MSRGALAGGRLGELMSIRAYADTPQLRNAFVNLAGQALPLLIALFTLPIIIHQLGLAHYGVLALTGIVVWYFNLFDFGFARATTKYVAESLSQADPASLRSVVWTSFWLQLGLGFLSGGALALLTPWLVGPVLGIEDSMIHESRISFWILAATIPIGMGGMVFRGLLKGGQDFVVFNTLQSAANILTPLVAVVFVLYGYGLVAIVLIQSLGLLAANLGIAWVGLRKFPPLRKPLAPQLDVARKLFRFGSWIAVINVVSKVTLNLDRFLIGTWMGVAAVGLYSPAYTLVSKLMLIPQSLDTAVFPAFSALATAKGEKKKLEKIFSLNLKYQILILGPLVLVLTLFAEDVLLLWLGPEFSEKTTTCLQILAVGFLLNALAWPPSSLLQGTGHARLVASIFLVEAIPYIALACWLIPSMGILGAALAWAIRGGIEAVLFLWAGLKTHSIDRAAFVEHGFWRSLSALLLLALASAGAAAALAGQGLILRAAAVALIVLVFLVVAWRSLLSAEERESLWSPLAGMARAVLDAMGKLIPAGLICWACERLRRSQPPRHWPGWSVGSLPSRRSFSLLLRRIFWRWFSSKPADSTFLIRWHDGIRILARPHEDMSKALFLGGCYEPNEICYLQEFLKPGMHVADIGAHIGLYTTFAATRVGEQGRVLSFEPSAREREQLSKHLALNQIRNVRVFSLALADRKSVAELHVPTLKTSGHSTLGSFAHPQPVLERSETVQVETLDDVLEESGFTRLDLIKMDTEGSELFVLRGAEKSIDRHRPLILLEANDRALAHQNCRSEQIWNFFREKDYTVLRFEKASGRLLAAREHPGFPLSENLLAIPKEKAC